MSTIQDDDLMLVERNGVSYKVTGEDVKDQLGGPSGAIESPVAIISPEDGAGMSNVSSVVTPAATKELLVLMSVRRLNHLVAT